jgi:hypothetical protein
MCVCVCCCVQARVCVCFSCIYTYIYIYIYWCTCLLRGCVTNTHRVYFLFARVDPKDERGLGHLLQLCGALHTALSCRCSVRQGGHQQERTCDLGQGSVHQGHARRHDVRLFNLTGILSSLPLSLPLSVILGARHLWYVGVCVCVVVVVVGVVGVGVSE